MNRPAWTRERIAFTATMGVIYGIGVGLPLYILTDGFHIDSTIEITLALSLIAFWLWVMWIFATIGWD